MIKTPAILLLLVLFAANLPVFAQDEPEKTDFRRMLDKGNLLRIDKPDSAQWYYHRALAISTKNGNRKNQHLAKLRLADLYYFTQTNPDSSLMFYRASARFFKHERDTFFWAEATMGLGTCFYHQKMLDSSLYYFDESLVAARNVKAIDLQALLNNTAMVLTELGRIDEAIERRFEILEIVEKQGNKDKIAGSLVMIGDLYRVMKDYKSAENFMKRAEALLPETENDFTKAIVYNSLGNLYETTRKFDKALELYEMTLEIIEPMNVPRDIAILHANMGALHADAGRYKEGLVHTLKAIEIRERIGEDMELVITYNNAADALYNLNRLDEAEQYALKGYLQAKKHKLNTKNLHLMETLSHIYRKKGAYAEAYKYLREYSDLKDSVHTQESREQLAEMQTKYETEKQRQENELLRKENELEKVRNKEKDAKLKQNRTERNALLGGLAAFAILLIVIIIGYRQKRKANKLLAAQHDMILTQKEEITDSIQYAQKIQRAILPQEELMSKLSIYNQFILYRPKDIVSGDFFWVANTEGKTIIAVADCTGHGVPGAFMSMLGITFLNEIVLKNQVTRPGDILNHLREEIINALKQKGLSSENKDGMDMSLICMDTSAGSIEFAGANNPLLHVRKGKLTELKGDNMPVAIYEQMKEFGTQSITIEKGDMVYLYSDGYPDQFGGPHNKKFKSKRFKDLLLLHADKSVSAQKTELEVRLDQWMAESGAEQLDDITVMGIRI